MTIFRWPTIGQLSARAAQKFQRVRGKLALAIIGAARHLAVMQSENPLISDFVKLMNSAAGTLAGMTREAREGAKERFKETLGGLDFVSREEFDAVKDMAARAREEVEALKARIAALETPPKKG